MNGFAKRYLAPGAVLLLFAGCAEQGSEPLGLQKDKGSVTAAALTQLTCTVNVNDGAMSCDPASEGAAGVPGANMDLIVGSQHQFVRMANTTPTVVGTTSWSADVTVQNLTLQPMSTANGSTAALEGVRVFFVGEPTNGVQIGNSDGSAAFIGSDPQLFYEYAGAALGADGILSPGEVSAPINWQFLLNGASTFRFSVLISTAVPDEGNYGVHLTRVDGNSTHTCGDGSDGKVYCWGLNNEGALGDSTTTLRPTPVAVKAPLGVMLSGVSVGTFHTCANGSDNNVYCWGTNFYGQLGDGTSGDGTFRLAPVAVDRSLIGTTLSGVTTGQYHSCAVGADSKTYCWGRNHVNQLGDSTTTTSSRPVAVKTPGVTLSGVTAGWLHTCAMGSDENVYCWGGNASGQIGDGSIVSAQVAVPVAAPVGVTLSAVAAGGSHTCAVGSDGSGYCWGNDNFGQLGNGAAAASRTPVAVTTLVALSGFTLGVSHTCAQGSDANTYCWGLNLFGQLGNVGSNKPSPAPVLEPTGVSFSGVAAGGLHTCAIGSDGKAYCWGSNSNRHLGNGRTANSLTPEVVAGTRRP